jgi:hypothetical protein
VSHAVLESSVLKNRKGEIAEMIMARIQNDGSVLSNHFGACGWNAVDALSSLTRRVFKGAAYFVYS